MTPRHSAMPSARAGHAPHRAAARLGHPVTIAIAALFSLNSAIGLIGLASTIVFAFLTGSL